ncbi:16S rRNA (guanine(966)-N(2))-methyltransferase RsmD [Xanthobacter autotrophicus DSM 431]|uniref:16S rRNA (guanine(966)-N(2))-methyltransferase RsmD n=1 Tax=Xanthobacter nonsaccharivorans TaxID=3119912 RepID=UPI00372AA453
MRIVGGTWKGRTLKGPSSSLTRPTSDRLRESLFNMLAHAYGDPCENARVLDLFAGTGALSLEALSRGARFALFVEEAAEARGLIRDNVEALGLTGVTRIFRRDATRLGEMGPGEAYSLVFCDPPYGKGLAELAISGALAGGWLAPDALLVVEERTGAFVTPDGFREIERRAYDESELIFLEPVPLG